MTPLLPLALAASLSVTLPQVETAVQEVIERAPEMIEAIDKAPAEMAGILVLLPYGDEPYVEDLDPEIDHPSKLLDLREEYWRGMADAVYRELQALERESALIQASTGDPTDADLVAAGKRLGRKKRLEKLHGVIQMILKDIPQDREFLGDFLADPDGADGAALIARKRAFFETLAPASP